MVEAWRNKHVLKPYKVQVYLHANWQLQLQCFTLHSNLTLRTSSFACIIFFLSSHTMMLRGKCSENSWIFDVVAIESMECVCVRYPLSSVLLRRSTRSQVVGQLLCVSSEERPLQLLYAPRNSTAEDGWSVTRQMRVLDMACSFLPDGFQSQKFNPTSSSGVVVSVLVSDAGCWPHFHSWSISDERMSEIGPCQKVERTPRLWNPCPSHPIDGRDLDVVIGLTQQTCWQLRVGIFGA